MNKKNLIKLGVFAIILMLALQACNLPGTSSDNPDLSVEERAQTIVAETLAASEGGNGGGENDPDLSVEERAETIVAQTVAASGGGGGEAGGGEAAPSLTFTPSPTMTDTPSPTITLTATITLTPTLDTPMVSVSVDTNCRTGPGKIYDYIGALLVGEKAEVVGQSTDGLYWIIKNPDLAGECWLWANYATVEGPVANLPLYTPPPTPTPAFFWDGNWTVYTGDPGGPYVVDAMTVTIDGTTLNATIDMGGGDIITITGTISDDYLSVSGSWTGPVLGGTFVWYALGANQFQGQGNNTMDDFAWCGSRGGSGQPAPCFK